MTIQDGQVKWKIKDMRTHHMCGEIVALVTTPPDYEHLLLCNGQTISADDYPELVAALGSNVLPNLNGRILQGAETAGEYKEAGLPNITGGLCSQMFANKNDIDGGLRADLDQWSGALCTHVWSANAIGFNSYAGGNHYGGQARFNASKSNSIYGNSTTVQPPAYTVRYYICYG